MRLQLSLFLLHAAVTLAIPSPERRDFGIFLREVSKISGTTVRQSGLNLSPCTTDSSCVGDRRCVSQQNGEIASCTTDCVCFPSVINDSTGSCSTNEDCDDGESCIAVQQFTGCVADEVVPTLTGGSDDDDDDGDDDDDDDDDDDGDDVVDGTDTGGTFTPASSGRGLTGDACSSDDECTVPRSCTSSASGGLCVPPVATTCTADSDCVDGEICVSLDLGLVCVSEVVVNANIPSTEAPSTTTTETSTEAPVTTTATTTATEDTSAVTVAPSTTEVANSTELTTDDSDSDTGDEESTTTNNPILGGIGIGSSDNESTDGEPEKNEESSEGEGETANGLTLDPCQNSDGCAGSRTCRNFSGGGRCSDSDDCRCFPTVPVRCEDDSACDEGEGCFGLQDVIGIRVPFLSDEFNESNFCISRAARDDAVCIASHSLAHISREHLVFEKDAVAHVLCDVNDSCATPGHMVQYKGEGMMMKSYCELTRCVRKVMKVNSPKYRRGITVPSHTEELVFTGLAARFQSRAEEGVLSVAVRFGF